MRNSKQPTSPEISLKTFYVCVAAIFVLALAIRLVHVQQIRPIPLFFHLLGDAEAYDAWAQQIAGGDWVGKEVFYQAPLYPYFLAAIYKVFGHDLLLARAVQALIGAAACAILALAGKEFFSRRVGVVAGMVLAIYPTAIFFDSLIQKSVLDAFLICLLLYLLGAVQNHQKLLRWLGIGAALGALMLTRENAAVLVVVVLAWAMIQFRNNPIKSRLKSAGLIVAGCAIFVLPVMIRNGAVGGEFHVTTSQLGPNLFIGNSWSANGAYVALRYGRGGPEYERIDATEIAEQLTARKLSPGEVSWFWTRKVVSFIRHEPTQWLRLMWRKCYLFWNATELGDTEDQYAYADWSAVLRLLNPVIHFGLLAAIAAAGCVITWHDRRRLWILYALIIAYAASVIAFYVMARYRFPIVPALTLFAAAALVAFYDAIVGRNVDRRQLAMGLALAVVVFFSTRGFSNVTTRSVTYRNIGEMLYANAQLNEAEQYFLKAQALWPDSPALKIALGRIRFDEQKYAEANQLFAEAIKLAPNLVDARLAYGSSLLALGDLSAAEAEYRAALAINPNSVGARESLEELQMIRSGRIKR